ncbi:lipoyl(octanoyl) transferase LipB [Herbaspirillum sp.]|uniref:lipoyl(octanoyl) transferase LipB n=1 Tax=Herbaspirillum sp. TaxID=1890675 RepID=UPI001B224DDF|nr:lipoyl(octanoyl) transferase LipB [Herbaspirillum sp.]MBO9537839.1 lipoyl(octanoyl) transferase LipB [Herbaspirillum sp.]
MQTATQTAGAQQATIASPVILAGSGLPQIVRRGVEPYEASFAAMRAYTDARTAETPDQLWIVEHPPVYTLGLGADRSHVLNPHDIPVVQTDRGGEVTFHGPGQVVIYLLMDLRRHRTGARLFAREFVHNIEQAVIDTLAAYNLAGERKQGAPGIYAADGPWQGAKVAALGLKIRGNGCTYHGVSLNVDMDLTPFSWINPCGYEGLATVDMKTLGAAQARLADVQALLAEKLIARFTGIDGR